MLDNDKKELSDEDVYGDTSLLGDQENKEGGDDEGEGDEAKEKAAESKAKAAATTATSKVAEDLQKEMPQGAGKVISMNSGGQAILMTGATHARELLSM